MYLSVSLPCALYPEASAEDAVMGPFFSELLDRRVPHVLGVYLAAGWALLEFSSWAEGRYDLQVPVVSGAIAALALSSPSSTASPIACGAVSTPLPAAHTPDRR